MGGTTSCCWTSARCPWRAVQPPCPHMAGWPRAGACVARLAACLLPCRLARRRLRSPCRTPPPRPVPCPHPPAPASAAGHRDRGRRDDQAHQPQHRDPHEEEPGGRAWPRLPAGGAGPAVHRPAGRVQLRRLSARSAAAAAAAAAGSRRAAAAASACTGRAALTCRPLCFLALRRLYPAGLHHLPGPADHRVHPGAWLG